MNKKLFCLSLFAFFLISCKEEKSIEKPALVKEEIQEYTQKSEDNQEEAKEKSEENKELNEEAGKLEDSAIDQNKKEKEPEIEGAQKLEANSDSLKYNGVVQDQDIVLGDRNSKVVFVEYFSPTCPHCAVYHKKIFPEIKKKYLDTNKIAYVMREFIGNKQDLDAAILAHCPGDVKSYLNFMDVILRQQESWAYSKNYREILTNISTLGGISPEKYATCLQDDGLIEKVVYNTQLIVKEPKFVGTPSFFINGKFTIKYTLEEISDALDQELKNNEL